MGESLSWGGVINREGNETRGRLAGSRGEGGSGGGNWALPGNAPSGTDLAQ